MKSQTIIIRRRLTLVAIVLPAALLVTPCAGVDKTWNQSGGGSAANPAFWTPSGVPGAGDTAILPNIGGLYTVTTDASWSIDDLEVRRYATAHVNGYNLSVSKGGDINGTLLVQNATFTPGTSLSLLTSSSNGNGTLRLTNGIVAGGVNTSSESLVVGYGTINDAMSNNNGTIRAEGGTLNITLAGNDHDNGTLSAATGGTLHFASAANLTNRAAVNLEGGTLWGYQHATYNLINDDSASSITGRGTIDRFYLHNNLGAVLAPGGGTLTLAKGFAGNANAGTINLAAGATLAVGQAAWSNNGTITMTGGSITGQTLQQTVSHTLSVTAGATNAIQNVSFTAPFGAALSNGATLAITGTGTLANSTIRALTGGGKFNVSAGGVVTGRGTVEPGMDIGGTLNANVSGGTLTVSGASTVLAGGTAKAESGGTLAFSNNLANRGEVRASGGTVNATGTILAATEATGDFAATSGSMNLSGATIQSGARNTFTANSGGTITLPGGLSTANLFAGDALRPRGGTLTVPNGATLTHGPGKTIAGYGQLLETGRSLANQGTVRAENGTLALAGTLANHGQIETGGSGTLTLADAAPTGSGTFTANTGGLIRLANGFTNAGLTTSAALLLEGGTIALSPSGTMTNATGKTIRGYGTLLESGQTLDNRGLLEATGNLTVNGAVTNSGNTIRASGTGRNLRLNAGLTNSGLVELAAGATLTAAAVTTSGRISLDQAGMTVPVDLSLTPDGYLDDNGAASTLTLQGNLTNRSAATGQFSFAHSSTVIFAPGITGRPHDITWLAADLGAELAGLDANMAIGNMVFGDGIGAHGSDPFRFSAETILYAYGLGIREDAALDLNGATLYYLRDGLEYNGIRGTGLLLEGSYKNGRIIEIIPEPRVAALFTLMLGGGLFTRRRTRPASEPQSPTFVVRYSSFVIRNSTNPPS